MIAKKIVTRTLFLTFVGISIITILCINELFNGTGLTHPMWDITYNWIILIGNIIFISFVGGLISTVASIDSAEQKNFKKTATNGGYRYGHKVNAL